MAGEWKTIEQREMTQRRARRSRRRGIAAVTAGAGLVTAAEFARPGLTRVHVKTLRSLYSREAREKVHPMLRHDLHRTMYQRQPLAAVQAGGAGLAAVGGVGMAQGRAREAYQQSRINARRRSRMTKSAGGERTSALNRMGGAYRGRRTPNEEVRAMGELTDRFRRKPGAHAYQPRVSSVVATRLARVAKTQRTGGLREQGRFGAGGVSGRRIIEKADPSGRKPTIARTGGRTPVGGAPKQPRPSVIDGPVLARGKVTGIVPMAMGQQEQTGTGFGKADRYFDPEDRRQRRIGATAAAAALGGGALGYSGGKEIATTGALSRLKDPQLRLSRLTPVEGPLLPGRRRRSQLAGLHPNQLQRDELESLRGVHVTPRAAGKVGAGVALLSVAGRLARHGDDPRKRRWN